ncbi:unnamed protein product, partial [Haemonchus placei]|uniref:Ion_trans domain-containing protein n=1 Tax=Haemonchus placei TaxID=6290 RepID=A0A0N4W6Q1_HAEPC
IKGKTRKSRKFWINFVKVCFGFAAIFASSFIWVDRSVFFQFIYKGFGWQTLILFILVVTFIFALIILLSNLFGKDVLEDLVSPEITFLFVLFFLTQRVGEWCALVKDLERKEEKDEGMKEGKKVREIER